jgi:hypothetical protein
MLNYWNLHWCIGGDFNLSRFPSERSGEACLCPTMVQFSDLIFYSGLMDLLLMVERLPG